MPIAQVNIIDGKIWVQRDFAETGIADQLVAKGVPKSAIVVGFHAPHKRPFTEFVAQ